MTQRLQKAWAEGKLTVLLLMDVKGTFDYVSRNDVMRKVEVLRADRDLVR